MTSTTLLITLAILVGFGYFLGRARSVKLLKNRKKSEPALHSRPQYYGYLVGLWAAVPALLVFLIWTGAESSVISSLLADSLPQSYQELTADKQSLYLNEIETLAQSVSSEHIAVSTIAADKRVIVADYLTLTQLSSTLKSLVVLVVALLAAALVLRKISAQLEARNHVERWVRWGMIFCASVAIFTTVGIVFSVLFESIRFFQKVPITEFLFSTHWSPQTALRADQIGGSGSFGAIPLFTGTLLISAIALVIAVPLGLMTAIYLSEYASARVRFIAKPLLEILAGIPTVVYGFFAAITVAPFIRNTGEAMGFSPSSESALAAGLVMGMMIIPFVSSLSDDVISAVPQAMRDGAYALGATRSETIKQVVIPAALPGIVGGVLLAASRAIGETMIVVMAAGLAAKMTANPLDAVTTVTVQIVTLLTGDQEFDSAKTLAAFALGLSLFVVTLILNVISLHVVRKYREQYD